MSLSHFQLKDNFTVKTLVIHILVGGILFIGLVFVFKLPSKIIKGERGKKAIQMLDAMRRPFLLIKEAETRLLRNKDTEVALRDLKFAIDEANTFLQLYEKLATYNPELLERVKELRKIYKEWEEIVNSLLKHFSENLHDGTYRASNEHMLSIFGQSSSAFLATMSKLGEGEIPIHRDIELGSRANRIFLTLSGLFLLYLVGMIFYQQYVKMQALRQARNELEREIEERKQAEKESEKLRAQLLHSQKMEAIGRLAGGIAHDFNNMLSTVLGYSEMVLMRLQKDDPLYKNIEIIYEASERAASLTRQLLAFSRKQIMEIRVVNLTDIIKNMWMILESLIGEDVEMELKTHTAFTNIKADRGQIEQVIMNLAVNARDAMPHGGRLIIEIEKIELDEDYVRNYEDLKAGSYVVLSMTDTGHGMTADVREKIFEPFFTTKEMGKGTGLGLATVYGIVKQLNGHIAVYSEPGVGTTFKIYFPAVTEEAEKVTTDRTKNMMLHGNETILVVDDEPSVRKIIAESLQPLGYKIITAPTGMQALEICHSSAEKIDLLLTDIIMPGMNGRELAKALTRIYPDLKVIYMSGYMDNIITRFDNLEPGSAFISKPILPSALSAKLREVLDAY